MDRFHRPMARPVKQTGPMKKSQLKLKRETIRTLTADQLRNANGGYASLGCTQYCYTVANCPPPTSGCPM